MHGSNSTNYILQQKVDTLLVLTLVSIGIAISFAFTRLDTFGSTTVPFSQNRLMQSIGELHPPHYSDWVLRYGNLFLVASLGLIGSAARFWGKNGTFCVFPLILFCLTIFFRDFLDNVIGHRLTSNLFLGSMTLVAFISLTVIYLKNTQRKNEFTTVACAAWFLLWIMLARDARRYDFFVGLSIAYFAAYVLTDASNTISEKLRQSEYTTEKFRRNLPHARLKIAIALLIFAILLFWVPPGKQVERLSYATKQIQLVFPRTPEVRKVFQWMKTQLLPSDIVATNPDMGSQLNVLAGVRTVTDQDHYIQHWIHLYNRHVFGIHTNEDILQFLKTHEATHLLLTANDVIFNADTNSNIGTNESGDIRWEFTPLQRQVPQEMEYRMAPDSHVDTPLEAIDFDMTENTLTVKAELKTGDIVNLPAIVLINKRRVTAAGENEHGGVVIVFDEYQHPGAAYYIPVIGWESLAVRLYFRGDIPDIFHPVYPPDRDAAADVKVWEIHYPPDIKTDPKYLKTGIPEIDKNLQFQ